MQTPIPTIVIGNVAELERAKRRVAELAGRKSGTIDGAVRVALLHAIENWEKRRDAWGGSADKRRSYGREAKPNFTIRTSR